MTSTITDATLITVGSNTYSTIISVIVIVLLLALLLEKELVRAFGSPRSRDWMQALDIAIMPLILAFGIIILVRFIDLTGFRLP